MIELPGTLTIITTTLILQPSVLWNNTHTSRKIYKTTLTPVTKLTKQDSQQNTLNTPLSTLTIQITTPVLHPQYSENRNEEQQEIEMEGGWEEKWKVALLRGGGASKSGTGSKSGAEEEEEKGRAWRGGERKRNTKWER
jgi:hypothetical protein